MAKEMRWTDEQKKVIDMRNCNMLVSAAAGSGKTAVLVARIMARIMDAENPANVDEFLIVTFTNAAAAQMKERLVKALEEALEEDPDNEHLQKQIMLAPMAQISTIHSFCTYVIQNYFHKVGIDPSYRIATDNELGMIKEDVMAEILEEKYASQDEGFLYLAGLNRFSKGDEEIEKIVRSIYEMAMSNPFPKDFLCHMKENLMVETEEELQKSPLMQGLYEQIRNVSKAIENRYQELIEICESPGGPKTYLPCLQEEKIFFGQLATVESETRIEKLLSELKYNSLSRKKQEDVDEDIKKQVQAARNAIKSMAQSMAAPLIGTTISQKVLQLKEIRQVILPLLDLTETFMDRYYDKKREKSVADYNDLEQMALEILIEQDSDGNVIYRETAQELSEQFVEIMIDEYQDSNLVQDYLLTSVSNGRNLFMVGDIKQSIYRFRMARPELFLSKLSTYSQKEGDPNQVIFLSKNFRSRDVILEGTNAIFDAIMHEDLGGVEYDEEAKLKLGADFPETSRRHGETIDVIAIDGGDDGTYEGKIMAEMIQEYTGDENPLYVYEDGNYRKAQYRDIVILTRKGVGRADIIQQILSQEGIPVYMERKTGFFETREIGLMIHMLQVIDNPRQDIPLVATLRSPAFGFQDDELALIRGRSKKKEYYDALLEYDKDDAIGKKIQFFFCCLQKWRQRMTYATVADLLQDIYDTTHIDRILSSMGNGGQRKANLDMLMDLAREYDGISYRGLYQFMRYVSAIKKRDEQMGEANCMGDGENVVRIMTIHKSKGLEFPICFLAGMSRTILGGEKDKFLEMNPDVGIATKIFDSETGRNWDNFYRQIILQENKQASYGEELRILYVAMTRAQEKLVMIGSAKEKWFQGDTDYISRMKANQLYQWILPVAERHPIFRVKRVSKEDVKEAEVRRQADVMVDEVMLNRFDTSITYDEKMKELLDFMDAYEQEPEQEEIPTKLSVSEIKRRSMEEHDDEGFTVLDTEALENQSPIPAFAGDNRERQDALAGANYGTVWHQAMAAFDFATVNSRQDIEKDLESMVQLGRMRKDDITLLRVSKLLTFFQSPLGCEMKQAAKEGKLHREQPFVIGVPATEVLPDTKDSSTVLIQGIIDGFYETSEGIVLMDYKTDRLEAGGENVLVERYKKQMELYAKALERVTGEKVVRKVLYSFSLNREIEV